MCNSTDMVKQDGLFVCQHCGTKYSVEEAKKLMLEGKIDVSGSTVKVDNTNRLENLYTLARRAIDSRDLNAAHSYYTSILLEEPDSWEAIIYSSFTNIGSKKTELLELGIQMMHSIPQALKLIKEKVPKGQQLDAVKCVATCANNYGSYIADNVEQYLQYCFRNNVHEPVNRWLDSYYVAADIKFTVGEFVLLYFSAVDDEYETIITNSIESAMNLLDNYVCCSIYLAGVSKKTAKEKIQKYAEKIRTYNAFYQVPQKSSGCYVATAVYGSYDCPQVWTLRRFRDNTLAATWYGRAFIRTYYAISPALVKWFGNSTWFKKFWRGTLDKMVTSLQKHGIESTPYQDISW